MGMMHRNKLRRVAKKATLKNNIDTKPVFETQENNTHKYTKTEINRMSTAELQELATEIGILNANETSGGELKKILIEHFNL